MKVAVREQIRRMVTTMVILPQEIIDEILYRLPIKSLFRFKSVCKRWLSTISGPDFDLDYKRQFNSIFAITSNGQIPKLYFIDDVDKSDDDATPIKSFSISVPPLILKEHNNKPCKQRAISNACNGLVLLRIGEDSLVLFNPSTRYSVKALTLDCLDSTYLSYCDSIGLCYDASIDDYKALVMQPSYNVSLVFVSCLKSKKWVRINDAPFNVCYSIRGPLVNGHIHWTIPGEENDQKIIYFDESKNNFEVLPSPPEQNDHQYPLLGFGVLDGCLSIARRSEGVRNCIEHNVEVVAMKKYGEAESWTTLYVLSNLQVRYLRCLMPLHLSRNGEEFLFMTNSNEIWVYNPTSKSYKKLDRPTGKFLCATSLVQTIVSPAIGLDAKY